MSRDVHALAAEFKALPIPDQLRVAAAAMEGAVEQRSVEKLRLAATMAEAAALNLAQLARLARQGEWS